MVIYMKMQKKIRVSVIVLLMMAVFGGCGDDNDVIIPTVTGANISESEEAPVIADESEQSASGAQETISSQESASEEADVIMDADAEVPDDAEGTEDMEGSSTVSITISAAGDTTLGNYFEQGYSYSFDEMYDKQENKSYFFQNVYDIFSQDDMTIVNLEGMLTTSENLQPGRTYNIKGAPEYVEVLTLGSVEAVSMENNHRMDYGEEATEDTVAALEGAGISYAYADTVGIYETKGIRIGFVSVNEASHGTAVEKTLENGIARLKENGVDLILACCHWGTERENYPEEYQRSLGQKCIDWGADLVLGHHPHVLQGIEEYQGKYIVHSLANFCFGANRNPADKDTMIFQQTFTFVEGEKQEDTEIRVIPCSVSSVTTRNDYCPTPAEGEEAKRIIGRINEYSKDFGVEFTEEGYLTTSSVLQEESSY